MIILILEIVVGIIVLIWINFNFKNIENKLDMIYEKLDKKKK